MNGFNRVFLMGYLGADPELKTSKTGKPFVQLSLATHHNKKTEMGLRENTTTWHRITVWGKRAETCHAHLQKGVPLAVEGYLSKYNFDRGDGSETSTTSVIAKEVHFVSGKSARLGAGAKAKQLPLESADRFDSAP